MSANLYEYKLDDNCLYVIGSVTGWSVGWGTDRPFAVDMAGVAINLSYLLSHTSAKFASSVKIGYQESEFLKHLVHLEDLEPLSTNKILVWHTRQGCIFRLKILFIPTRNRATVN